MNMEIGIWVVDWNGGKGGGGAEAYDNAQVISRYEKGLP